MTTIDNNWLVNAIANLPCGRYTARELQSIEIGKRYELLLAKSPTLFDDISTNVENTPNLTFLYNKIICGDILSEEEVAWANAEIARLELVVFAETDAQALAAIQTSSHYVYAAGIHTWNDGAATAGDIPVTSLLTTDIVHVTLHTAAGAELVESAAAAAGQINVVLSANGTDTTTKLNYSVLRAMPAS